jgi:hypothetical protein
MAEARTSHLWSRSLLLAGFTLAVLLSCTEDKNRLNPGNLLKPGKGTASACSTPQTGCACEPSGQVVDCGAINERLVNSVTCSLGTRECVAGKWSECKTDRVSKPVSTNDQRYLALGAISDCTDNPCDPYCLNYVDDPFGLAYGDGGLMPDLGVGNGNGVAIGTGGGSGNGLSLQPGTGTIGTGGNGGNSGSGGSGGGPDYGGCSLTISPTNHNFTVTSFSPFSVNPPSAQYEARLSPASCDIGVVTSSWTLSNPDTAVITDTGAITVYSPVAQTQTVRAYAGSFQAIATATVTVAIQDTSDAPAGTAPLFTGVPVGPDTAQFVYPYANTLFPRGIRSPALQWVTGALGNAEAVKVSVRFPVDGAAQFSWSTIVPGGNARSVALPQDVWLGLDQSASNSTALISIQRVVGGQLYQALERPIKFSSAPLRGRIYYTEYQRGPDTRAGPSCWFNNNGTVIRALDPGSSDSPINPFGNTSCGNVCHSVSADGTMFVSSGEVAKINSNGSFTHIANPPGNPYPGQDSRGFAWAGITPDGQYVLQGNNIWGNTQMGDENNTGASRLSSGNGNGLFAEYFNNTTLSGAPALTRIDQTVDFTWLNGSPGAGIGSDGFSARWYGYVQPLETETYTFETQTNDGVRLWVGSAPPAAPLIDHWVDQNAIWTADIALNRGEKYWIEMHFYENSGEAQAVLRWSSPNTAYGAIPLNQLFAR